MDHKACWISPFPNDPQELWQQCQHAAYQTLTEKFGEKNNTDELVELMSDLLAESIYLERRRQDYVGGMLWHQSCRSTEFLSKYIRLKNAVNQEKQ